MRVLFVSSDKGGCRWYRCLLPARELAKNGHHVLVAGTLLALPSGEIGAPGPDGKGMRGFDVVVLQRWMNQEAPRVIRRAREFGQAVVNDVDDWFFGIPQSNAGFEKTHVRNDAANNVDHYRKALASSTLITASTPYLAERLKSLGRPVTVLRNLIDLERWDPAPMHRTSLVLGWYGHTSYRAAGDLRQLAGVLGPFMDRHPKATFVHGGSWGEENRLEVAKVLGVDETRVKARPMQAIDSLPRLLAGIDVGVAPLEDCPFNQAKSWIKPLEFASAGIPCVASDLPEYRAFGAAPIARRPKDWTAELERLVDPEERLRTAQAARRRARELDIEAGWQAWERTYMTAANGALLDSVPS